LLELTAARGGHFLDDSQMGERVKFGPFDFSSSGQTEQSARVVAANFLSVDLADLTIVEPAGGVFEAFEWVIDGVQNSVATNLQHRREKRWRPEVSAGRQVYVLAKILAESALARNATGCLSDDVIYSPNVEWNAFTQMAEDHL
jgi:hypothetical protein